MSTSTEIKKRNIPFIALGGVWEQDDIDAAMKVITAAAGPNGNFFPLPEEADFQKALVAHEGSSHAVAVNSCGTALDLCMMALVIQKGDEVIVLIVGCKIGNKLIVEGEEFHGHQDHPAEPLGNGPGEDAE